MEQTIDPTLGPVLARTGDERAVLTSFLDFHRAVLLRKLRGLSDADARRRLVPSATTLVGLVKHLTLVERNWFPTLLAPEPGDVYLTSEEDAVASFTLDEQETIVGLTEAYERACARSREVAASVDLDHVVPHPQLGEVSVRWILVHMIEETARHAGHADILRELTDGECGAL
ncbi:DinB family protein [Micromonospora vinacea]|uniref:Damage-inducible protein DinB n=1 Tax=Micromonospora vinacea TaxID=709878 RepID=A0ABS0JTZ1_9ACTN|nr:DinB family protein [Micromonospora vinacea]MBG6099829.1 putative damage-inducible protein DinB [Micromonospora vinacea]WTA66316.1 DinB family protein [Micromonospora sp. NBC_00855]